MLLIYELLVAWVANSRNISIVSLSWLFNKDQFWFHKINTNICRIETICASNNNSVKPNTESRRVTEI